ncbi:MAG TPA: hypothetical protein VNY51_10380 [Candidatus Dormibacteraeota bacterium]|nr:hypothetical protein [Candidatus Dormibacteraeota bacterium]
MIRRLLDVFSLVVLTMLLAAPAFMRAQGAVEDRVAGPGLVTSRPVLPIEPQTVPLPFPGPLPPNLPRRYPVPLPPGPGLKQLVQAAGIIFSGRVTFIGRSGPVSGQAPAATTITFQVEQAMRGTATGQSLTIHEWAGLWNSGERYHIGEHVLLFLYPPSKFGLTSPVSGSIGRFAMGLEGKILVGDNHAVVFTSDPILGGKRAIPYLDFAHAVGRVGGEE